MSQQKQNNLAHPQFTQFLYGTYIGTFVLSIYFLFQMYVYLPYFRIEVVFKNNK
jgi:hypothetical protein